MIITKDENNNIIDKSYLVNKLILKKPPSLTHNFTIFSFSWFKKRHSKISL